MKSKYQAQRNSRRIPLTGLLLATALFPLIQSAHAVDYTWDGEGGTNGWGNSAHWVGNTTPTFDANANIIFYQAGTTNLTTYLGAARLIGALTFNDNADSDVSINLQSFSNVAVTLTLGSGSVAPTINVNSGAAGNFAITNTGTVAGSVILANNLTVNHNGSGDLSITRPISGSGFGITKNGTGSLILSGENTYTGANTVSEGTLIINGSTSSTSLVTVASGAALGGGGTVGGATTIQGTGTLSPGDGVTPAATLTLGSNLTLDSGAILALGLGSTSDLIDFTSVADNLLGSGNATLQISQLAGFNYASTYTIFQDTSTTGFTLAGITGYDNVGYTANFFESGDNYLLSFTAVPEPSAALLGGLGLLALLRRRR